MRPVAAFSNAPSMVGAFFLFLFSFSLASCQEQKKTTPEWEERGKATETTPAATAPPKAPKTKATQSAEEVRFIAYNLKNYLSMSRYIDGERKRASKPAEEIEAVVRLLAAAKPDILGLCEIGSEEDLKDLQKRLRKAGLDLPHSEHTGGADKTRHLGLLSRFPIAATNSQRELFYTLEGERRQISRGILDATVTCGPRTVRFLGVHLKSKREIPDADQELIRRNEAFLLRKHADSILKKDKGAFVVVYGDFNDTRRTTTVRSISGPGNSNAYLEPLSLKDSRGEVWTHYWDYQHIYSRFDYIMVSKALRPLVNQEETFIIDEADSTKASDHRPTQATFRW
jgi:endonuclease/exonuclease/phosphatase family metal-dependent hydrolase